MTWNADTSWNVCVKKDCRGPVEGPGGDVTFFDGGEAHCIECGREYMVHIHDAETTPWLSLVYVVCSEACGKPKWHTGAHEPIDDARPIHMFQNGNPDWVIAWSAADAVDLWCEQTGEPRETYNEDYGGEDDWEALPDDKVCKFWLDENGDLTDDGGALTELTAGEACKRFGRRDKETGLPFFASSDF